MIIRTGTLLVLLSVAICTSIASAQERVSLKPVFTVGQESRYSISATVDTTIAPSATNGIAANSRRELTATVVVRTVKLGDKGEVYQEVTVEAISLNSKGAATDPPETAERKIEFTIAPAGQLVKCSMPNSPGYQIVAELLLSTMAWYPGDEVAVGGSWEAGGHGPVYTGRLSTISKSATTVYKPASLSKGIASIDGAIMLSENGTSVLNAEGISDIGVVAGGKGTSRFDFDVAAGRLVGCVTESRLEGKVSNTKPSTAGEKLHTREGSLIETSKFSIKLIQ